jgi:hypothetical protein
VAIGDQCDEQSVKEVILADYLVVYLILDEPKELPWVSAVHTVLHLC